MLRSSNPIPAFEEITDRILDAARDVVEDMYAENAKNYVGLDTNPIEGMNVARDKNNILIYKKDGTIATLSIEFVIK